MVGSLVGEGGREISTEPPEDEGSESSSTNIEFMYRKVYDNIINRLQLPSSNQVNVKLTVVEVTKGFTDSLGIDWSSLTLNSIVNGGSAVNPTGTFNLLGFKGGFDAKNISTVIQAVNNDSLARVLAQPNLTVLSGESASFLVGGEIPIIVQDNDSATVSYKEYGVRLNVAAKVEKKQRIKLFVSNELSSVSGSYAFNEFQIPTLRTRKSSSTIELSNGDSFVIGGLLSEEDRESLTKIPFIGDIPVLGALARSAQTERRKTELVVFATVNLVEPSSTQGNIPLPRFRRTPVENLFTNVGVDGQIREGRLSDNVVSFMSQGGFAK
jgi:pilus assembly protein CpaC